MTPTKATFKRTVSADAAAATATGSYAKAIATPTQGRLGVTLYCNGGTIQWTTWDVGKTAPSNNVMGQLSAGQSTTVAAEDSQDLYVRGAGGSFFATELVQ